MFEQHPLLFPFLITLIAGLGTSIGSIITFMFKHGVPPIIMRFALGFSAGVMLYISFVNLLQAGIETLGFLAANIFFFAGIAFMAVLDNIIPHEFITDKVKRESGVNASDTVIKAGLFIALGITIHNIPEGMAVFTAAIQAQGFGIGLAISIGVHNIPEGMAVAIPIYAATKSKWKSVLATLIAGLMMPVGAALVWIFLYPYLTDALLAGVLSAVGGIMTYISFDEILPLSLERDETSDKGFKFMHEAIWGIVLGMILITVTMHLFG